MVWAGMGRCFGCERILGGMGRPRPRYCCGGCGTETCRCPAPGPEVQRPGRGGAVLRRQRITEQLAGGPGLRHVWLAQPVVPPRPSSYRAERHAGVPRGLQLRTLDLGRPDARDLRDVPAFGSERACGVVREQEVP
jgi:hypothetical protein